MLEECRTTLTPLRVGVSSRLVRVPRWKLSADRIFAQVTYSIDDLLRWRDTVQFEGEILAGVMVVTSAPMARRLGERVPQLRVADSWIRAIERDPRAGVDLAVALIDDIRTSGAFSGVHVIAGGARDNLVDALQLARSSV
jgi:5,10-methylenetetrahydrofolate reductase